LSVRPIHEFAPLKQTRHNSNIAIQVLASGSAGNAILISSGKTNILIDAGLSCKELTRRMTHAGVAPDDIAAVIITHEHTDHARGVGVFSRQYNTPVYMNAATLGATSPAVGEVPTAQTFSTGDALAIYDLSVQTYPVLHDAADPIGLIVSNPSKRVGIALDMGHPTTLVKERLRGSDALILEFNHDPEMLRQCRRPWEVKQRILSKNGHMSNEAALKFLSDLIHDRLQCIVLAHISREANSGTLASSCVEQHLAKIGRSDIRVHVALQDEVGATIEV
jgi:phosphoribosyl 1,2-cyclic phosphodiesterase